jgi:hypothetical protein
LVKEELESSKKNSPKLVGSQGGWSFYFHVRVEGDIKWMDV